MSDPTVTVALIAAGGPIVAVIISAVVSWLRLSATNAKLAEVHVIVNSQRTEMEARIESLKEQVEVLKVALTKG